MKVRMNKNKNKWNFEWMKIRIKKIWMNENKNEWNFAWMKVRMNEILNEWK